MAFVLIQHLEPRHKSALSEILSRETSLSIREAKNNAKIEPSHVYVIPPNTLLSISHRRLKITTRIKRADGRYLPIDFFMASLAKGEKERAIGIVLSGTGSDGTEGAKAIKAKGGTVFVQDEATARYFGMPESAIKSGAADFVLGPGEIARRLARLRTYGYGPFPKLLPKGPVEKNDLSRILNLLRDLVGVDFSHYKKPTIERRIARQMTFHNITNYADYYNHLKRTPGEVDVLRKDILIPVTSFFRDPDTFAALRKKVLPIVAKGRSPQNPVRLWVPACSTGEEVYSLAILLFEFFEEMRIRPHIQIYGTDLSEALIEKARAGLYADDMAASVPGERLRRFFTRTDSGYKIVKPVRDLCIFAKHDITGDPPLSNMDIVSCRNLLIYLDAYLQQKTLLMLHYALKPKGFLVLGTSESVAAVPGYFSVVDKKQKIYSKNVISQRTLPDMRTTGVASMTKTARSRKTVKDAFLKNGSGASSGADRAKKAVSVKRPGPHTAGFDKAIRGGAETSVAVLKKEFARTVERLNAISEEKDTFNEELRAANEEIQSSNEELQSMNEELETSKEELQSTNEELLTLNEELQNKNAELTHLNSDLSNVFSSTNIPIIIVGNDLKIKRFTPTARKVMNLIPTDVDRPIGDIKPNINIVDLEETIRGVIEDMAPRESEVLDKDGRWYSVRIRPYRTVDNKIDGAVIALIDIDLVKRSREEVLGALHYAQAIIETMREPLVVLDKDVRILSVNKSFCDMFKTRISDVKDRFFFEIGGHQWDYPKLRKLLREVLSKRNHFNDFEVSLDLPEVGPKDLVLNGRQIKQQGHDSPLVLLVIEDITKRKRAEDILKRDKETLDKIIDTRSKELIRLQMELVKSKHMSAIGTLAATVAHELRNPLADISLSIHRVKKGIDDPSLEKILAGINSRVSECDQIISNILMYSKSTITHYESVKVNDILTGSIEEEAKKIPEGKITFRAKIGRTKDLVIEADPIRIKEVFRNILNNSVEAIKGDAGIIEIETRHDGPTMSILIKDNGEGISRKDLEKVASPFFTTKAKGTGLGLSVCKQVVMLHSGSLSIDSDKGKGTTVKVTLPLKKSKDA